MVVLWRLLRYVRRYWPAVTVGMVSMLVMLGLNLAVPWVVRQAIDHAILGGHARQLGLLAFMVVGLKLATGVFAFGRRYSMEWVAQRVIYDLRNALYQHLQGLSFSFYDQAQTGQLMSRCTQDVETLRRFVGFGVVNLVYNALTLFGILILMIRIHWRLALLSMVTIPFLVHVVRQFSTRVRPAYRDIQAQLAELTTVLQENVTGVRVVRAFAQEKYEEEKFHRVNWGLLEKNVRAVRLWAYYFPLMNFISALGTTIVIWYGGREVIAGRLSLGSLVAFGQYLGMLVVPLRMLGWILNLSQRAIASGQRVFELLDTEPEIKDAPDAYPLPPVKGHVVFENVSFAYATDPDHPVLKNVSFEVLPGQTVALLGATGSGKSTVINLIPRFYDPTEGRILVDGHDIRKVTLESLRRQIGIVLQETFLFNASIKENIAYGRPGATQEEIVQAAKAARIHDFIMTLPQKYDTIIGERGISLSGGQKQRVAIARALLMDPRILILDDSTSSVDTETEHLIQEALHALMKDRTTFVIAQRLSTIKNAHLILILRDGEIVERGTHAELLQKGGIYREIYELQFKGQEEVARLAGDGGTN